MGQRGPAPAPKALKLLKGQGEGRDSAGRKLPVGPEFTRRAPAPPDEVSDDPLALEAWNKVVPHLEKADVLREVDFAALSGYCTAYGHFKRIEQALQADARASGVDAYLKPTRDGTPTLNPLWRARDQANAQLKGWARELGLTPSAEHVLGKPADDTAPNAEDNPFG